MNKCDYCQHVEMCGWRKSLEEKGCDFFDDGNKWIPCSERLPESDVDVLTQYSDYSMSVDFRTASSSGWFWAEEDLPIAWMPLPKPYEPQESEG
jgi:hypothetical protein